MHAVDELLSSSIQPAAHLNESMVALCPLGAKDPIGTGLQAEVELPSPSTEPTGQTRLAHGPDEPIGADVPGPQVTHDVAGLLSSSVVPGAHEWLPQTPLDPRGTPRPCDVQITQAVLRRVSLSTVPAGHMKVLQFPLLPWGTKRPGEEHEMHGVDGSKSLSVVPGGHSKFEHDPFIPPSINVPTGQPMQGVELLES